MRLTVQIHLVKDYGHRDVVHLTCHQDTVKERKLDLRIVYGRDNECTVKICSDDMGLAGKVCRFADDVVLPRLHRCDGCRILKDEIFHRHPSAVICKHAALLHECLFGHIHREGHVVTHGHRIGRCTALKPDLSSQHSRKKIPLWQLCQQIMAAGVLYYCRLSVYNHDAKIAKTE